MANIVEAEAVPPRYLELIKSFRLRPIVSDEELEAATKVFDGLVECDDLSPDEEDYFEILVEQIKIYEERKFPRKPVSSLDMLRFLIESREVSQADVAKTTKIALSTLSEILNGSEMNLNHIEKFAGYFSVDAGVFIDES